MGKISLQNVTKTVRSFASKHSPEILTGIGIAGMFTTVGLAVGATTKAVRKIDQYKEENLEPDQKITPKEVVKLTWKYYVPAAVTGTASAACLIGASKVHLKRNALLATAYTLSETALAEYKEKVVETIGEKKEKTVREAIAKDKIDKDPVENKEVILTGKGDTLCYDAISGRYFKTDIEKLKRAENELNRKMLREDYISLNEFYDEIGLSFTKLGDDMGWHIDKGFVEFDFSSQLASDGTPCLVLDYKTAPTYGYDRLYG